MELYNTLTRKREIFQPLHPPFVGLYVCGPTVYGDPHLGHARPAITFDILFRYLKFQNYKVRYVRNITDVGHLENDRDEGEDKIAKKARLENIEPMEVAQYYTNRYRQFLNELNVLPPSIEPLASGHILEQIELIQQIFEAGYAYEVNGSVYFDVLKYNQKYPYGKLSGRVIDELLENTRTLDGQDEKKNNVDFALWKKASPHHIMRWNSPWSMGFPGWHLECSAMSTKYLGETFDIHGGGMDLLFPHHECEIAQSVASKGHDAAKVWIHNNMITIDGQKMGKSLGNFITLEELFTGNHQLLEQSYHPMTVRFFILQAHYRSTLDFTNEALQAAEKGLQRVRNAYKTLQQLKSSETSSFEVDSFLTQCCEHLDDDLNTAKVLATLADYIRKINAVQDGTEKLTTQDIQKLTTDYQIVVTQLLGIALQSDDNQKITKITDGVINLLLELRLAAKKNKDYSTSDKIRLQLEQLGVTVKDKKEGFDFEY